MAGRDPEHPGDGRRVHLDLVRDLGEDPASAGPLVSKTSTADPIAWVSSGRSVSPSTKLLSAVSRVVVVIVIGCLRPGA
jgi:hypothetical protein